MWQNKSVITSLFTCSHDRKKKSTFVKDKDKVYNKDKDKVNKK